MLTWHLSRNPISVLAPKTRGRHTAVMGQNDTASVLQPRRYSEDAASGVDRAFASRDIKRLIERYSSSPSRSRANLPECATRPARPSTRHAVSSSSNSCASCDAAVTGVRSSNTL